MGGVIQISIKRSRFYHYLNLLPLVVAPCLWMELKMCIKVWDGGLPSALTQPESSCFFS